AGQAPAPARHVPRAAGADRRLDAALGGGRRDRAPAAQPLARAAIRLRGSARAPRRRVRHTGGGRPLRGVSARLDPLRFTPAGEPRRYIGPHAVRELWFHTGTACNLACPFCLEGSKPGDRRLDRIRLDGVKPLIDEAVELGVEQFSFTGGEPFILKPIIDILAYAADRRPCLVLNTGTDRVLKAPHPLAP